MTAEVIDGTAQRGRWLRALLRLAALRGPKQHASRQHTRRWQRAPCPIECVAGLGPEFALHRGIEHRREMLKSLRGAAFTQQHLGEQHGGRVASALTAVRDIQHGLNGFPRRSDVTQHQPRPGAQQFRARSFEILQLLDGRVRLAGLDLDLREQLACVVTQISRLRGDERLHLIPGRIEFSQRHQNLPQQQLRTLRQGRAGAHKFLPRLAQPPEQSQRLRAPEKLLRKLVLTGQTQRLGAVSGPHPGLRGKGGDIALLVFRPAFQRQQALRLHRRHAGQSIRQSLPCRDKIRRLLQSRGEGGMNGQGQE